jgi:selenocysteine lyase/cysteine desulfurase
MAKSSATRRNFLKKISIGSLATLSFTAGAEPNQWLEQLQQPAEGEAYWEQLKKQFSVPVGKIMLNAANLCPSPTAVYKTVTKYQQGLNADVSMKYRAAFGDLRARSIGMIAEFLGVTKEEVGITRNTSEANCLVVNGLDFTPEDEVLIWDQNHPSNKEAWQKRSARYGFKLTMVRVPALPGEQAHLVKEFESAITANTKLIAFSHISNTSGLALPAKEICALARSKGILTLVDGAQSMGFMDMNLRDLGCDFYTASTHKWLMGPMENGVLYVNAKQLSKVWPNIIGGGWRDNTNMVDDKVCFLGQRNDPTTAAIPEMIRFHTTIGKKKIEERVRQLNAHLKTRIKATVPAAKFITPLQPEFSGGIVIINIPGKEPKDAVQKLYDTYGIAAAATGGIRLSPHIYNTIADVDKVVEALSKI